MTTNIDFLSDDTIFNKDTVDYDNLPETIFDLTLDIKTRMHALELYYEAKNEETIEIIVRLNGMYQISGISILEQFLFNISLSNVLSVLLRLEAVKSLIMYNELEDEIEDDDTPGEKQQKDMDNEIVRKRNTKRMDNSSKSLNEICKNAFELPTPCRVESLYLLMNFEKYKEHSLIYFSDLVNDQNIDCEFRYYTILSLETKCTEYMKNALLDLFDNKAFVRELFTECAELISKEFPNFVPTLQNEVFFQLLVSRLNFDISRKMFNKYVLKSNNFEYVLFNTQLAFLFYELNMTYYRILSGQYLLQKCKHHMSELQIFDVEKCLLSFAEDTELDYDRRADAADVLLRLGSSTIKEFARVVIMRLGGIEGCVRTVFENAQNVHTEEVESSVSEALEFFAMMPLHMVNKQVIEFDYVKEQVEKMLKDERDLVKSDKMVNVCVRNKCIYNCVEYSSKDEVFCSEVCETINKKENKIKVALNRINMDRALYSKYNSTLSNILIKVWSYLAGHEYEEEMRIRLLEELEEMSGTCSSGFASRLINVISGFGQFNIRISWEDQIIANFTGRLNAAARKIMDNGSIFYNEKVDDVMKLWLNGDEQQQIKQELTEKLKKSEYITENPTMIDLIKYYMLEDREEKVEQCVEYFAEKVLSEMALSSSNTSSRLHFSLFFRTHVAYIREEMYQEFKDHLDDTSFDLYMRKSLMRYDGC